MMEPSRLFIGGQWVDPVEGGSIELSIAYHLLHDTDFSKVSSTPVSLQAVGIRQADNHTVF